MEQPEEQSDESQQLIEYIHIPDWVPTEILEHIIQLTTNSNAKIFYRDDNKSCIQFGPRQIIGKNSNQVTLDHGYGNNWIASINLNPCEIGFGNADQNSYLFTIQCWKKDDSYYNYHSTDYRIDDDLEEKRFMASGYSKNKTTFFDGANDDGVFLIAGNAKYLEYIESSDNKSNDENKAPQKASWGIASYLFNALFGSFFGIGQYNEPAPKKDNREIVYEYYLGKFTAESTRLHQTNIYKNTERNNFDFRSPKTIGTLSALALCKNKNRYAFADNNGIKFFAIEQKDEQPLSTNQIGLGLTPENEIVQKISFITPKTLLGITKSGKLFSFTLNETTGEIGSSQQKIVNKEKKPILLHTFAVNPCDPHQLILCTQDNELVYLNLRNCDKPTLYKPGLLLMKITKRNPESLWFYDNKVCFGSYQAIETNNFSLHDLDLKIKKTEKNDI